MAKKNFNIENLSNEDVIKKNMDDDNPKDENLKSIKNFYIANKTKDLIDDFKHHFIMKFGDINWTHGDTLELAIKALIKEYGTPNPRPESAKNHSKKHSDKIKKGKKGLL